MANNFPFPIKSEPTNGKRKPIQEFISQIKSGGLARTNRYIVMFSPPNGVASSQLQKIMLFCDQIQVPGCNYSTVQNRTYGEFREVPYERIYDNITMSFYVDTEMKVKELFDNWQNVISDPTTRSYNYYKNYICDMKIEIQDIEDKTRYTINLYECYPKTIGSVQMDYASKDIMKLSVGMQYKYWTATPAQTLATGEVIPTTWYDKMTKNFTGFQEAINQTIGTQAGNFLTGSAITYGVTKLPGLLKF